jgi:hypothetical protein
VVKYIDTSLDWADNNEKWNSQEILLADKVLKESKVFSAEQGSRWDQTSTID